MINMRVHVWAFIVLVLASCVGCVRDEHGGCYFPGTRTVTVDTIEPPHLDPASVLKKPDSANQLGSGNTWQDLASLGPNKTSSGISARDTAERSDERDRKY